VDRALKAKGKRKKEKVRTGLRLTSTNVVRLTFAFYLFTFAFFGCTLKANRGGVPPPAQAAIDTVGADISSGNYEKIYSEAAEEWRQAATREQSDATFKQLKEKLGNVRTRSFHSATEQDGTGGHSFILRYTTSFDRGEGMETFTLVERDGRWLLARYFVNSDALK
jgi:Protein of unknown function (DUF4019)/Protein of unknown function (DUF3887)